MSVRRAFESAHTTSLGLRRLRASSCLACALFSFAHRGGTVYSFPLLSPRLASPGQPAEAWSPGGANCGEHSVTERSTGYGTRVYPWVRNTLKLLCMTRCTRANAKIRPRHVKLVCDRNYLRTTERHPEVRTSRQHCCCCCSRYSYIGRIRRLSLLGECTLLSAAAPRQMHHT